MSGPSLVRWGHVAPPTGCQANKLCSCKQTLCYCLNKFCICGTTPVVSTPQNRKRINLNIARKHRGKTLDLLDWTGWNTGTQNIFPRWFKKTILFLYDSKWRIWPSEPFCHLLFLQFSVSSLRFILTEPHFSLSPLQFNLKKPLEGLLSFSPTSPASPLLSP